MMVLFVQFLASFAITIDLWNCLMLELIGNKIIKV